MQVVLSLTVNVDGRHASLVLSPAHPTPCVGTYGLASPACSPGSGFKGWLINTTRLMNILLSSVAVNPEHLAGCQTGLRVSEL